MERWLDRLVLGAALVMGCSVETTGLGGPDAEPAMDAGRLDAGAIPVRDAAGAPDVGPMPEVDAGAPDAAIDAGPSDAGTADAGPPDAGPPSCDELYDTTNGYFLCDERDDECMFFARLDGISCDDACAAGTVPGTCTGNEGNSSSTGPDRCTPSGGVYRCDEGYTDHICICSKPR